jgi:hypothetical protein
MEIFWAVNSWKLPVFGGLVTFFSSRNCGLNKSLGSNANNLK